MKFRLTDGSIVEAEKDCGCLDEIRTGPHWVHMDDFDKRVNWDILPAIGRVEVAKLELVRLRSKRWHMDTRGICEIIREDSNE